MPGEQALFFNVDRVENRKQPQVLAGASRASDQKISKNSYSFVAKSPIDTKNVSRVMLPKKPKSVKINGQEKFAVESWDKQSMTYLVAFDNDPKGVQVQFAW